MSTETRELIDICERLPEAKRAEVANFVRFLLAQQADERWEQIVADSRPMPKLDQFLKTSKAEGSEPHGFGPLVISRTRPTLPAESRQHQRRRWTLNSNTNCSRPEDNSSATSACASEASPWR